MRPVQEPIDILFISGSINESDDIGRPRVVPNSRNNYVIMSNEHSISLLSLSCDFNVFEFIPKTFTLTTINSSAQFNTEILMNTSNTILEFVHNHPGELEYHLDIKDDDNVISKIESLYQGKNIVFDEDELSVVKKITRELLLIYCPKFMKTSLLQNVKGPVRNGLALRFYQKYVSSTDLSVKMSKLSLEKYLQQKEFQTFTIKTNKNEYKCNIYGCFSSNKIRKFLEKNPESKSYVYEYEDDEKEFQLICNIFNFEKIQLTKDNSIILVDICKDLEINCLINLIDTFINDSEKVSQTIDDQQNIINKIDEMFDLLYNIKDKSIDFVAKSIKDSKWIETEENVIELSAFILQVAQTNICLQSYLIDLLINLNEEMEEINNLKILIPTIVKHTMLLFNEKIIESKNDLIFPFLYKIYKKGLVSKEELQNLLNHSIFNNSFFASWFLPELLEFNPFIKNYIFTDNKLKLKGKRGNSNTIFLYYPCNYDNMEEYKKLRDKYEYDDIIANAIRNDDVDTFQSIISKSGEESLKSIIKKNMFEPFFTSGPRYLNYAAYYGSIKCFKYLLLNHEEIDKFTFICAIIGGNNELIRIVNNNSDESENEIVLKAPIKNSQNNKILEILLQLIKIHRNDLFDWLLEQNFDKINQNNTLFSLVICSIENGNAHTLVQLIDYGFNFQNYSKDYSQFLRTAAEKGFYLLLNLLLNLINKDSNLKIQINAKFTVYYNNLFIFKYFAENMNKKDLEYALTYSIKNSSYKIIKYFFEVLINQNFQIDGYNSNNILINSIQNNSIEMVNYLIEKIDQYCPLNTFSIDSLYQILIELIKVKYLELSMKFIYLIHNNNSKNSFTNVYIQAGKSNMKEIINHIIDNKYRIDYNNLTNNTYDISAFDSEIFESTMKIVSPEIKRKMLQCIDSAISQRNKPLIKLLLKENAFSNSSLIQAVKTNDIEIVEMILNKNSSPSFINQNSREGTALQISVNYGYLEVFHKLISVPGIDPNIYNSNYKTPLIIAISKLDLDIFNSLIKFYGENIKNQKWQLEKAINIIIDQITPKKENENKEYDFDDENDDDIDEDGDYISPIDFNDHYKLPKDNDIKKINEIIKTIINLNCIDPNHFYNENTLLTYAVKIKSVEIVQTLLQCDSIDVNLYSPETGDTPLITSIKIFSDSISNVLINYPKTNINQKNYERKTPLIIAIECKQYEIVNLLLNNNKFDPIESNINFAFLIANNKIAKQLFSFDSLDINYIIYANGNSSYFDQNEIRIMPFMKLKENISKYQKNYLYTPPLIRAVQNKNVELIDLIVNHPRFDKQNSQFYIAISIALFEEDTDILKTLFNIKDQLTLVHIVDNNNSLIIDAVNDKTKDKVAYSTLNFPKFTVNESYIELEISYNGYSNTRIVSSNSQNYVNFVNLMLHYGVDPNKANEDGYYPLEESIINNCEVFTMILFKLNTINFDQEIPVKDNKLIESKFTTYFNLSIVYKRFRVINEIINRRLCNFNLADDLGDTPLIIACKQKSIDTIRRLFEINDIDYLHRNNNGDDALKISIDLMGIEKIEINEMNKEDYFNALINILNGSKDKVYVHGGALNFPRRNNILQRPLFH